MTKYVYQFGEPLLMPGDIAKIYNVDAKTVTRWGDQGRLTVVRTIGGQRRFLEREIRERLAEQGQELRVDEVTE